MKISNFIYMTLISYSIVVNLKASIHTPLTDTNEAQESKYIIDHPFLDPYNRPKDLQASIDETYNSISSFAPQWNYNGSNSYAFLGIDGAEMIESLIKASPHQKEFYVLDIGAGDFRWGKNTVSYLNNLTNIAEDITIHVISVTGENYGGDKIETKGKCKQYNFDKFKIENLYDSFKKRDLNLENKIDLIVSQYTFVHLQDPVGTFVQAYNLLRPDKGLIMMHSFIVPYGPEIDLGFAAGTISLIRFLHQTKMPYLLEEGHSRMNNPLILQRQDEKPLLLALKYAGQLQVQFAHASEKSVTYFEDSSKSNISSLNLPSYKKSNVSGDYKLFESIWNNYPQWQTEVKSWQPLYVSVQEGKKLHVEKLPPELFLASQNDDLEKIKKLVEEGEDINKKNAVGIPLIFTTSAENIQHFILSHPKFDPNILNEKTGQTPAHFIIGDLFIENPGSILLIKLLLNKNLNLNIKDKFGKTPLDYAAEIDDQKNPNKNEIISLLKEKGAISGLLGAMEQ